MGNFFYNHFLIQRDVMSFQIKHHKKFHYNALIYNNIN